MRSGSLSLGILLFVGGACSQIIGLGDYENTDSSNGGDGQTGGASATGGSGGVGQSGRGGTNSGGAMHSGATAGEGGDGGIPGSAGAGPDGGVGAQGGVGNAGSGTAGAGGAGGEAGEANATGGTSTGGALSTGGTANGGALNTGGAAGKGGSGGTTGGTGGRGGSGGTTGGAGGKGGTGGGATGGKGGTGGTTCATQDMLLGKNPNFDNSNGAPPLPAPWVQFASDGFAIVNRRAILSTYDVAPHTGENALVLGGVGSDYDFNPGLGEVGWLDLDLTIPVGATQVTLSCYYQTQTLETSATISASRDKMVAWFWDDGLQQSAYQFQWWYPSNSSPGWHLFSNTASGAEVTALAGKTLTLEFFAQVDDMLSTYFFIDTCSLLVTVCN